MTKTWLFYCCLILSLSSCKDKSRHLIPDQTIKTIPTLEKTNLNASSILMHQDTIVHGGEAVFSYLEQQLGEVLREETRYKVIATADSSYVYKISQRGSKQGDFAVLEIWNTTKTPAVLELQYLAKADGQKEVDSGIAKQRDNFMLMVAAHDVAGLIDLVYTSQPTYYNQQSLIQGASALKKEYSYMQNPSYSLTLTPLHIEPVNEQITFEIGQCAGGYNGKYILIWQRQNNGTWQVRFDANM